MKTILFAVSMLLTLSAFASQEIYESFNVEEQVLPSSRMEIIYQKAAGGITCTKTKYFEEDAAYVCKADIESFDSAMIYGLLQVEEVLIPSSRLEVKHQKKVGGITCVKTRSYNDEISYNCSVQL